jgi:outer membrane protein assembly factor BamD
MHDHRKIFWIRFTMKIMKILGLSLGSVLLALLAACSSTTDPAEAYRDETAQQIFQEGENALVDRNYSDAIKHFEALDVQYPFGRNTQVAQLHIIYAYYKNSDFLSAETAADRFIHAYPSSPNVDYAYYMRGLSNYYQNQSVFDRLFSVDYATRDLTQVKKSFNDFSTLETRYPTSPYAPAAHQYTIYLRNVLANHQVEVAMFYFNRQAYVAAANRASLVVEHYQGAPVVPDALVIMVRSYHQLHETELEEQAAAALRLNYENSIYAHEVSGKELGSKRVYLAPHKEKPIPPAPQASQALMPPKNTTYPAYTSNGSRGSTTPVSEIVKSMQKSGWFTVHPKSETTTTTTAKQTKISQQTKTAANQSATKTAATPGGITLKNLWQKLSSADFFSTHSKSDGSKTESDTLDTAPASQQPPLPVAQNGSR